MKTKEITATNPETFAKALVACLGADKGISASAAEVVGDVPGTWAVLAEGLTVTIRPNPNTSMAADRLKVHTLASAARPECDCSRWTLDNNDRCVNCGRAC